jgi:hypothetical protein
MLCEAYHSSTLLISSHLSRNSGHEPRQCVCARTCLQCVISRSVLVLTSVEGDLDLFPHKKTLQNVGAKSSNLFHGLPHLLKKTHCKGWRSRPPPTLEDVEAGPQLSDDTEPADPARRPARPENSEFGMGRGCIPHPLKPPTLKAATKSVKYSFCVSKISCKDTNEVIAKAERTQHDLDNESATF